MKIALFVVALLLFGGCVSKNEVTFKNNTYERASWQELHITPQMFARFAKSYNKSCDKTPHTRQLCPVRSLKEFKTHFMPLKLSRKGFMTGYYEPTLQGSLQKDKRFAYPIYKKPNDMYTIKLASVYEELDDYRLRGRIVGDAVVPYYDREHISQNGLDAEPICYVDNRVDAFFLQIQGSGKVRLQEGDTINVGYVDQNGHRYYSIGRYMHEKGYLKTVSMKSIRQFLEQNPDKIDEILHQNQSYVFFEQKAQGATGALGVELTPYASAAVDAKQLPLGLGMYIKTDHPAVNPLVVAQDVGGAIEGAGRVDYFFGPGSEAAKLAGGMKEQIELFVFVPRDAE